MTACPELIRYPYQNQIPSDNSILGNCLSRAVTKSHIPRSRQYTWNVPRGKETPMVSFFIGRCEIVFRRGSARQSLAWAEGFACDLEAFWRLLSDRQFRAGIQTSNLQSSHRWSRPIPSWPGLSSCG